jgi:hypothetical protein
MAPKPGRSLKAIAVLLFAAKERAEVPIVAPDSSRTTIVTVVVSELGLTMATAVVKLVSSQMRVLVVDDAPESGTTAS